MVYSTQTARKMDNMTDHPLRLFNLKTYPWIVLGVCMLAGVLLGLLISFMLRPVYEAQATLTANLEIVREGNVTEIMVDSQMTILGSQVYDSQVVEEVLQSELAVGNNLSYEDFRGHASFERQMMNTLLKYRDHDPVVAQRVVNTWVNAFHDRLLEAYPYGLAVSEARDTIQQIAKCNNDQKAEQTDFCSNLNPEVEEELKTEANAIILKESLLSLGLTSALTISNVIPADIPDAPLRYTRGSLTLGGALVGMVAGLILIEALPARKENNA